MNYDNLITPSITNSNIPSNAAISPSKIASADIAYKPNNFYTWQGFGSATAALTVTANRLYAHPFIARSTYSFSAIAVHESTAIDGSRIRFGIYSDSNGAPSSLIADLGQFTASGVGAQTAIVTTTISLTKDVPVWLAIVCEGAVGILSASATTVMPYLGKGTISNTRDNTGVFGTHTFGVLPSTFPAVTDSNNALPAIHLRA